jgi:hypothetical protein
MNIDINIVDVLNDCDRWEIDQVIYWLRDNDYLDDLVVPDDNADTIQDIEFKSALSKIVNKRRNLTIAEEEFIKSIANRF